MPARPEPDPLDALDPRSRRAAPRVRIAVGAAVVFFLAAVAVAAMLSVASSGGGAQGAIVADDGDSDAHADASGQAVGVDAPPLLVHVLGAVAAPGLVELSPGARVVDAVAAAGGFTPDADPAGVNLARLVTDGEQLVVLAVGQVPPVGPAATGTGGAVHLNTADVAALDTLPRIGPALAQRILDWRDANGPFTSVDQLLDVAGIGDAVFSGLVDKVAL
jgi:competence protein ComEA